MTIDGHGGASKVREEIARNCVTVYHYCSAVSFGHMKRLLSPDWRDQAIRKIKTQTSPNPGHQEFENKIQSHGERSRSQLLSSKQVQMQQLSHVGCANLAVKFWLSEFVARASSNV